MDYDKEHMTDYDKYLAKHLKGMDCTYKCDHYHYGYFGVPSTIKFDKETVKAYKSKSLGIFDEINEGLQLIYEEV